MITKKIWDYDVEFNDAIVRQLLTEQFPKLKLETLELIGRGFDNNVYRVNDFYTFRVISDILMGGVDENGKWIGVGKASKTLKEKTLYSIYKSGLLVTKAEGGKVEYNQYGGADWVKLGYNKDYEFATTAEWDFYPRPVYEKNGNKKVYVNLVRDYLKIKDINVKNPKIIRVMKADLDNDGAIETVIEARNFNVKDTLANPFGKYNLLLVFKGEKLIVSLQEYTGKDDIIYYCQLLGIADLNNDGLLELITKGGYYEGYGYGVYDPIKFHVKLDNGWGA